MHMNEDIKVNENRQGSNRPKIPNKTSIKSPIPISKGYFTSNENFREAICENLVSIYNKRELRNKFSLEVLEPEAQKTYLGFFRFNQTCLAKRLPKVFKISKEASIHIAGYSDANFLYQKVILGQMSFLEGLKISWSWDHYEKEGFFESLCLVLKRLKHLKNLDLDLKNFRRLNDEDIKRLARILASFVSLKKVTLSFERCKGIQDKGLLYLSRAFRRRRSLQHIHVNFTDCQEINKGAEYLSQILGKMEQLETLILNFKWCLNIPDNSFGIIGENLKENNVLKRIYLDFTGCWLIRENGIRELFKNLSQMKYLEELTLLFCRCDWITDKGLKAIEKRLEGFLSLKRIHLDFTRCRRMSELGLEELRQSLLKLPVIKHVEITFKDHRAF